MSETPASQGKTLKKILAIPRRILWLWIASIMFWVLFVSVVLLIPRFSASKQAIMRFEGYVVPVRPIPPALCDDRGFVLMSQLELEMRLALQSSVGSLDDAKSTPLATWRNVTTSGIHFEESGANLLTNYAPLPKTFFDTLPDTAHISPHSHFALSFKYRVRAFPDEGDPQQRLFFMLELRRQARDGGYTIVRDTTVLAELADRLTAHLRRENEP